MFWRACCGNATTSSDREAAQFKDVPVTSSPEPTYRSPSFLRMRWSRPSVRPSIA